MSAAKDFPRPPQEQEHEGYQQGGHPPYADGGGDNGIVDPSPRDHEQLEIKGEYDNGARESGKPPSSVKIAPAERHSENPQEDGGKRRGKAPLEFGHIFESGGTGEEFRRGGLAPVTGSALILRGQDIMRLEEMGRRGLLIERKFVNTAFPEVEHLLVARVFRLGHLPRLYHLSFFTIQYAHEDSLSAAFAVRYLFGKEDDLSGSNFQEPSGGKPGDVELGLGFIHHVIDLPPGVRPDPERGRRGQTRHRKGQEEDRVQHMRHAQTAGGKSHHLPIPVKSPQCDDHREEKRCRDDHFHCDPDPKQNQQSHRGRGKRIGDGVGQELYGAVAGVDDDDHAENGCRGFADFGNEVSSIDHFPTSSRRLYRLPASVVRHNGKIPCAAERKGAEGGTGKAAPVSPVATDRPRCPMESPIVNSDFQSSLPASRKACEASAFLSYRWDCAEPSRK